MTDAMKPSLEEQKANRAKWVAALRSGEYEQTDGALHDQRGFCCLGVACEVIGVEWVQTILDGRIAYSANGETTVLPKAVQDAFGLNDDSGDYIMGGDGEGGYCRNSLADLNDGGTTFLEIADLIESGPEGLFIDAAISRSTTVS